MKEESSDSLDAEGGTKMHAISVSIKGAAASQIKLENLWSSDAALSTSRNVLLELVNPAERVRSYNSELYNEESTVLGSKGEWRATSSDISRYVALDLECFRCVHAIVLQCGRQTRNFSGWVSKLKVHTSMVATPCCEADWREINREIVTTCRFLIFFVFLRQW